LHLSPYNAWVRTYVDYWTERVLTFLHYVAEASVHRKLRKEIKTIVKNSVPFLPLDVYNTIKPPFIKTSE